MEWKCKGEQLKSVNAQIVIKSDIIVWLNDKQVNRIYLSTKRDDVIRNTGPHFFLFRPIFHFSFFSKSLFAPPSLLRSIYLAERIKFIF